MYELFYLLFYSRSMLLLEKLMVSRSWALDWVKDVGGRGPNDIRHQCS
jgi:hypothetical protein